MVKISFLEHVAIFIKARSAIAGGCIPDLVTLTPDSYWAQIIRVHARAVVPGPNDWFVADFHLWAVF